LSSGSLEDVAERIERLEIQGATNVAISALRAVQTHLQEVEIRSREEFFGELEAAKEILFSTRPTEPLMRNGLRYLIYSAKKSGLEETESLVDMVSDLSKEFLKNLEASKKRIGTIGARRILDGSTILVHCHSSVVTGILREAAKQGKDFRVFCTETRPRLQGRITAEELSELEIEVTMIVDSAMRFFMNEFDLILVGADAITSEGNVINKIGTSLVALAAQEARTPIYVASELLKFDPATIFGEYTVIEERSAEEIWDDPPEGLRFRNPAFDITRREFVHGIICESGIISPEVVMREVDDRYPWIRHQA